jgi:polyisoprenoid-binding protein YceI
MPTFGPDEATCEVLTFREGLLSSVAHDLVLRVTSFEISVDEPPRSVEAKLASGSLRVVTALRDGKPLPDALSAADAEKIESTVAQEVLRAQRFPLIRFTSATVVPHDGGYQIAGLLTLVGATRELSFSVRRDGARWRAEVPIHQPDFGIRPYSGLLGTIRVKPRVVVQVSVPAAAAGG